MIQIATYIRWYLFFRGEKRDFKEKSNKRIDPTM